MAGDRRPTRVRILRTLVANDDPSAAALERASRTGVEGPMRREREFDDAYA